MASLRQPDDDALFFGYTVQDDISQPPAPPAGIPLLSENEHLALDGWLHLFGGPADTTASLSLDPVHSENWNDMPPQFVGSSTSFGQSSAPELQSPFDAGFHLPLMPNLGTPHRQTQVQTQVQAQVQAQHQHHPHPMQQITNGMASMAPSMTMPDAPVTPQFAPAPNHMLSDDVFSAANVLMQNSNGAAARAASFSYQGRPANMVGFQGVPDAAQMASMSTAAALLQAANHIDGPRHASMASQAGAGASLQTGQTGQTGPNGFRGVPAGVPAGVAARRSELQWGTDQSFSQQQFTPRSSKETSEALMHQQQVIMECLEVNRSAAPTRQATPTYDGERTNVSHFDLTAQPAAAATAATATSAATDEMAPPRKKRKSKAKGADGAGDEGDGNETDHGDGDAGTGVGAGAGAGTNTKARKRKPKADATDSPDAETGSAAAGSATGSAGGSAPSKETPAKRRRSAAAKAPRENLTESQKRENHIKSEQKRRTLIKNGFDDLCEMVPGLDGGSHSKSTMLMIAADYLEELLQGNKQLREQAGL